MGKKIRLNGFDFYNLSRLDKTQKNTVERGYYANTLDTDLSLQKNKYTSILNTHFDNNEFLEHMLRNSTYSISRLEGARTPEKQLIHAYRFKHSIGEIDFIDMDSVQFGNYGIVNEKTTPDRLNWEWIIDEDFSSWTDYTSSDAVTTSNGSDLQYKPITWVTRDNDGEYPVKDVNYKVSGSYSLKMKDQIKLIALNTKRYSIFELSSYFMHTSSSGTFSIIYSYNGYSASTESISMVTVDIGNNTITWVVDGVVKKTVTLTDITLSSDTWYSVKVHVENGLVSVYLNSQYIDKYKQNDIRIGSKGVYSTVDNCYVDIIRMNIVSQYVLSTVNFMDSSPSFYNKTVRSSVGINRIIYGEQFLNMDKDYSNDHVLLSNFTEPIDGVCKDKTNYGNDGTIINGKWEEEGYIDNCITVDNGQVIFFSDSSLDNMSDFNLHTRFKLENLDYTKRQLIVNPIIHRGSDFAVYDYYHDKGSADVVDGLIAHYRLDGNTRDSSGNGYHLQNSKITKYFNGKIGESAYMKPGTNTKALVSNDVINSLISAGKFTVSLWIKPTDMSTYTSSLSILGYESTSGLFVLRINPTSETRTLSWFISDGSTLEPRITSNSVVEVNKWYHIVLVYDGTTGYMYVNNVKQNDTENRSLNSSPSVPFYISGQSDAYGGYIDDVRFYNRILSESEIDTIYNIDTYKHRLAFEIYGEILLGDEIDENWIEAWFLSDGKSSHIYRRDFDEQIVVPEARKVLGELYAWFPYDSDELSKSSTSQTFVKSTVGTYTSAVLNNGMDFNGTSTGFRFGDKSDMPIRSHSFSVWMKTDTVSSGIYRIVSVNGEDASIPIDYDSVGLYLAGNYVTFYQRDSSGTFTSVSSPSGSISTGQWYHLVGVQENNFIYLYINGILISSLELGNNFSYALENRYGIGQNAASDGYFFNGILDDVRIYHKALTKEEIMFLYSKEDYRSNLSINSYGYDVKNRESEKRLHFKFNNNIDDLSIYDEDMTVSGTTSYSSGKIEQGFSFNGSTYLISSREYFLEDELSISTWFKITDISVADQNLCHRNEGFSIRINADGVANRIKVAHYGNWAWNTINLNTSFQQDVWYHITCAFVNDYVYVYINGVLEASVDYGYIFTTNKNAAYRQFVIGAYYSGTPSSYFNGVLEDFRAYTYTLTQDEITDIYNGGNGSFSEDMHTLKFNWLEIRDNFIVPSIHNSGMHQVRSWEITDYNRSFEPKNELFRNEYREGDTKSSLSKHVFSQSPITNRLNLSVSSGWNTDSYTSLSKNSYKMIATDDLQLQYSTDNIFNDKRMYNFTVSSWVKQSEFVDNDGEVFLIWDGTYDFLISIFWANNDYVMFAYKSNGTNYKTYLSNNTARDTIPRFKWFKLDLTFDEGVIKLYINGKIVDSYDNSANGLYIDKTTAKLDHDGYNNEYHVKDVRIYDRTLSDAEIEDLFNSDPLPLYQVDQKLVVSPRQPIAKNSDMFLENGLIGVFIHKAKEVEAMKEQGGVDIKLYDKGWESVGRIFVEDQES